MRRSAGANGVGLAEPKRQISAHAECSVAELETLRRFHDWPPRTKYSNSQTYTHTDTHTTRHTHTQRDTLLGPADNVQYVYAQYAGHSQHGKPNGECRSEYPVK